MPMNEISQNAAVAPEVDLGGMTQWQLIRRRFARHKLAVAALSLLVLLYTIAILAEFVAPYRPNQEFIDHLYAPPHPLKFSLRHGFFTNPLAMHRDPTTLTTTYRQDPEVILNLRFLAQGTPYRLWGLIPMRRHLFGLAASIPAPSSVPQANRPAAGHPDTSTHDLRPTTHDLLRPTTHDLLRPTPHEPFFLLGADKYGRCIFSRIVYGARISLSIGLIAIVFSFLLGVAIGGASGYFGGLFDLLIQRLIEILQSIPTLPLWIALGAVVPADWPPLWVYFGITVVLSLIGWTGLARTVRGKLLSLREEDYAVAARLLGASHWRIIFRHLVPGFTSHIIVKLTLAVPGMILGETSLSFLGLGLRPPLVSWGVMLQDCLDLDILSRHPWIIMPTVFVVLTVLAFNFTGDGLRDAADPYN